jgi:UDPglucose 6-dehydrogenase
MKSDEAAARHHAQNNIPSQAPMLESAVSVIGLGKLGACMAAAMASRGVRTIGVDTSPAAVETMQRKLAPVFEPGLAQMIASCDGLLHATVDVETAIRDSSMTFIVVPTPSNAEGAFSLEYVCAAMEPIGRALRDKSDHHIVVLTSTVLPGSTEYVIKPLLERISGKRCGTGFGLCYSPEFIALGSVLHDFLNPDLLLIGECDATAGERVAAFYRDALGIDAPTCRMAPVNAELAKIALNTYVTTKITFANLLAELCERLPGGDVDAVTQALGLDRRIGAKYLKGALGYGGPCFPRDNSALARLLKEMGVSSQLPDTVDWLNRSHPGRIVSMIEQHATNSSQRIAVLGLAYKPHTNVVDESQGVAIARQLADKGFEVTVFDPVAIESARGVLGGTVQYANSVADCVCDAAIIVVATDWPEFASVFDQIADLTHRPLIIDGWRLLRPSVPSSDGISYRGVGIGRPDQETCARLRRFVEQLAQPRPVGEAESKALEPKSPGARLKPRASAEHG